MDKFGWAAGRNLVLLVFLLAPYAVLAQAASPNWDETLVRNLKQSITERKQEIAALRKETRDTEIRKADAEEYLAGKYGAIPADSAVLFHEIVLASERTIRKNERALDKLERKVASAEALLEALPQIELIEGEAVSLSHWGDVNIRKAGSAAIQLLNKTTPFRLAPGDVIDVGENGSATFLYPEAAGEMMFGSRTRAAIETVGDSKDPRVILAEGKIRFWLGRSSAYLNRLGTKYLGRPGRFSISTKDGCVCAVRGTSFSVEATGDGGSEIFLFEGEIGIVPEGSTEEIALTDGQALTLHADGTFDGPKTFETTEIDAWWDEDPRG